MARISEGNMAEEMRPIISPMGPIYTTTDTATLLAQTQQACHQGQ